MCDDISENRFIARVFEHQGPFFEDFLQLLRLIFSQPMELVIVRMCLFFPCFPTSVKDVRIYPLHMHENFKCTDVFLRILAFRRLENVAFTTLGIELNPDSTLSVSFARACADKQCRDNPFCWLPRISGSKTNTCWPCYCFVVCCIQLLLPFLRTKLRKRPMALSTNPCKSSDLWGSYNYSIFGKKTQ